MLSDTQVTRFETEGYLVIENAISAEAIASIKQAATNILESFDINAHRTVFKTNDRDAGRDNYFFESAERVHCFLEEDALTSDGELLVDKQSAINKIGHAMHDLVPEFGSFCRQPLFATSLRQLGMSRPQLWQTMYIFKQPRIGGEVRWHQDASYLHSDPGPVIGVWIALEDATLDNGCLLMAPGGHKDPLREIYKVDWATKSGSLKSLDPTPWPNDDNAVALEVSAGSLVFFHDHMPHYSSANRSNRSRQAFTMHFADASSDWLPENWLQRKTLPPFEL